MSKKAASDKPDAPKGIQNRKARYDYELLDSYEAGIALVGSEVKSVYLGRANLADAFCEIRDGEIWLINLDVEPYANASHFPPERRRDRKLLLHKREIETIHRRSREKGFTIVPTRMYFKNGRVKVEVALARGKREYDRRDQIAKNETRREVERLKKERF